MSSQNSNEGYSGAIRVARNVSLVDFFGPPSRFLNNRSFASASIQVEDDEEKGLLSPSNAVENAPAMDELTSGLRGAGAAEGDFSIMHGTSMFKASSV